MHWITGYESPIGNILIAADSKGLCGLWFEGQRYYGSGLNACQYVSRDMVEQLAGLFEICPRQAVGVLEAMRQKSAILANQHTDSPIPASPEELHFFIEQPLFFMETPESIPKPPQFEFHSPAAAKKEPSALDEEKEKKEKTSSGAFVRTDLKRLQQRTQSCCFVQMQDEELALISMPQFVQLENARLEEEDSKEQDHLKELLQTEKDYSFLQDPAFLDLQIRAAGYLQETLRWLNLYFQGEIPNFTPVVHLQGTDFQIDVWKSLMTIPYGAYLSYSQLSRRIARKREQDQLFVRSVGRALGMNPISLIVPCHRINGKKGDLIGYAAGTRKKAWLLNWEAQSLSGLDFSWILSE